MIACAAFYFYLIIFSQLNYKFNAYATTALRPPTAPLQLSSSSDNNLLISGLKECPSTTETAKRQIMRLFVPTDPGDSSAMRRSERILRIAVSWILLIISKVLLLSTSVYIKALIEKSAHNKVNRGFKMGAMYSTFGLFVGVGGGRMVAGLVQLLCDLILSPSINSASEQLPKEAFSAALAGASRRCDDGAPQTKPSSLSAVAAGQEEGKSGYARRALDRGVKASGQFLYRSIFNLFPKV